MEQQGFSITRLLGSTLGPRVIEYGLMTVLVGAAGLVAVASVTFS